jgi:hypothetical protein
MAPPTVQAGGWLAFKLTIQEINMIETILKPGDVVDFPIEEAEGGGGKICSRGAKKVSTGGINYKYLPFAANAINSVAQEGMDVISYNFTGCLMAVFKEGGAFKVCHVSTGSGQDCKAEWENIKKGFTNVFEFRPSDFIETKGGAFAGCYGLITSDLRTFAITVVQASGSKQRTIAAITMARLLR